MSRENAPSLTKQTVASIGLCEHYWGESCSISLLNIRDHERNQLALYGNDYRKFVRKYKCQPSELSPEELIHRIEEANLRLLKYFSTANRAPFELKSMTPTGDIHSVSDIVLPTIDTATKEPIQNCLVMCGNRIYIHPKTRSSAGIFNSLRTTLGIPVEVTDGELKTKDNAIIGINHSSLSAGQRVQFAGSLVFDDAHGWVLENTTGHYQTRAYQLLQVLKQLAINGFNLTQITVKTWVANELGSRSADEADYHISHRNAAELLETSERSKMHCELTAPVAEEEAPTTSTTAELTRYTP
ncbi:MAG: hypothetical protein P1U34_06725 [Coxiellaceae bacterium]|nr:hypothetical protein [Coxiellaceae bacterium]